MSELILFWHRRDLRISDNLGLTKARSVTPKVLGVFCLDFNILKGDDIAPARVSYMLGCLGELQQRYLEKGSQLLILQGTPSQVIPQLARLLHAKAVYWNLDVEPYAQERDRAVSTILAREGIEVKTFWDQLLHNPEEILTGNGTPYSVYTPYWKNWSSKTKTVPIAPLEPFLGLTEKEQETVKEMGVIPLPSAQDLGFSWDKPLFLAPGEKVALSKLERFADRVIYEYDEKRNFPAIGGTSELSAAIKFGVIGIRTLWQKTVNVMANCDNTIQRQNVQTWQQELAWREFYQQALYHFPELAEGPYRATFKNFPWDNNQVKFEAWCQGQTGYPIIDAAMRQLNETGWMHNRCRMIVASFLTKDLIINWQWGEKYFMQTLIDGDLAANNGGWQWSASSGMDPKPLRIFNPASQAQKFDPNGDYIRRWVPELKGVDTKALLTGNITPLEARSRGYVIAIVDHNQQQRRFKDLYQQQKANLR